MIKKHRRKIRRVLNPKLQGRLPTALSPSGAGGGREVDLARGGGRPGGVLGHDPAGAGAGGGEAGWVQRRQPPPRAMEAGVPEHVLWMQSGHAQDKAARQYVVLNATNADLLF